MVLQRIDWNTPPEAWGEALRRCPGATAFHGVGWLSAMERCFGASPVRARFVFSDGVEALMALSLRRFGGGWLPLAVAGETGVYGGVLAAEPLPESHLVAALEAVRRRHGSVRIFGNPFAPGLATLPTAPPWRALAQVTHVLALDAQGDPRQGFSRGCKARCNKAVRLGQVVEWRHGPSAAAVFEPLYQDSVRRWGERLTWARPQTFFEAVLALEDAESSLVVVRQGDTPAAAMLFVRWGPRVHYVAGAARADALAGCPSNLAMEAAIRRYANEGATLLDMGPSSGLEGVARFKASFGARPQPFEGAEVLTWPLAGFLACRERLPTAWLHRPGAGAEATA
ncbi:MAG: GNAT family N-acetyltransferase [Candidatus Sericytochromatia bacterium]|nr:GNAT family N-acetyltransferase [Candidatus Sericytochromatia bacterium]